MSSQAKSMSEPVVANTPARSGPLASVGYVLLAVAVVGWIITVLRAAPSPQR